MTAKRKISIRKILQVFTTLVVTVCCIVAMVGAARIEDNKTVKNISVYIKNDKKYHFIEQKEIMDLAINDRNVDVAHTPLSKLDINSMERVILADPWVASAQVYVDNDCTLNIYVTQRIPVARVFQQNGASYYLDTTLSMMPLSANYNYYTSVFTNVPQIKNDSAGWDLRRQIVSLSKTIQADTFWNAQIAEVSIDSPGMYELTTVLGDQRIVLGDLSRVNEKLNNLFQFYKNVLNRIGWDKYEVLDLRFKGQVVASPSLPYTGPVDKAVVTMNWINSIVESEAVNDAKDSVKLVNEGAKKPELRKPQEKKPAISKSLIIKKSVTAVVKKAGMPDKVSATHKNDKPATKAKDNSKKDQKKSPKYLLPENKDH